MISRSVIGRQGEGTTPGMRTGSAQPKLWTHIGWALTGLVGAFMLSDSVVKLVPIAAVAQTLAPLGFPVDTVFERGLGLLGLVCTILFIVHRTSVLGAILMTGYLGGAIASQLRVGHPLFSHLLFGAYLGAMAWGGLWLRMPALRAIAPVLMPRSENRASE
jgi:hypothetical protein